MAKALIPEIKPKPADMKGVKIVMSEKLETCLILFDRAIAFLKSGNYSQAAFLGVVCSAIAGKHYKTRPRDATTVLLVAEGIVRAAVAHAEIPPALEYVLGDFAARCHGSEVFPCLGTSRAAREWISKKIPILIHEGYPARQAAAIAYSMARRRGMHVSPQGW